MNLAQPKVKTESKYLSFPSMRCGKKSDNHKLDNMDMVNSMTLLLEKERALSSIQVEEKEQKATLWRDRYMNLVSELKHTSEAQILEQQRDNGIGNCYQLNASMAKLKLCYCGITSDHLTKLLHKLRWLKNLTSLNLSHNHLDDNAAQALAELLTPQMKRLNLAYNDLGPTTLKLICNRMGQSTSLETLEIEGNMPMANDPDMAPLIVQAVCKSGSSLNCLSLTINDFPGNDLLATSLTAKKGNRKPQRVVPMGAFKVAQIFGSPAVNILCLSLCHARLHKLSIEAIAQYALPRVLHLDITGSFIGPSGAQVMAKKLNTAKNLCSLIITRNSVGSTGIRAIAKALGDIPSLTLLDVTSNDVSDDGSAALVLLLRSNADLAVLGCGRNPLSRKGAIELAHVAREQGVKLLGSDTLPLPVSLRSSTYLDTKFTSPDDLIGCIVYREGNETVSSLSSEDVTREGYVTLRTHKLDQCHEQEEELLPSSGATRRHETTLRLCWDIMCKASIRWQVARSRNGASAVIMKEGSCCQQTPGARSSFTSVSVTVGGWQIGIDRVFILAAACNESGKSIPSQHSQVAGRQHIQCKNFTIYEVARNYPCHEVWKDSGYAMRSTSAFFPMKPPVHPSGVKLWPLRQILVGQRRKLSLNFQCRSAQETNKSLGIINEYLNETQTVAWAVTIDNRLVETGLLFQGLDAQHNYCSVKLGLCFEGHVVGLWIGSHEVLQNEYELENTVHNVSLQAIDDEENEAREDDSSSLSSGGCNTIQTLCLNFSGPYAMCASAGGLTWAV